MVHRNQVPVIYFAKVWTKQTFAQDICGIFQKDLVQNLAHVTSSPRSHLTEETRKMGTHAPSL